jgi:hypothetical protein
MFWFLRAGLSKNIDFACWGQNKLWKMLIFFFGREGHWQRKSNWSFFGLMTSLRFGVSRHRISVKTSFLYVFVISMIFFDWKRKFKDSKLRDCNVHIVQQYTLFIRGPSYWRNWCQLDFLLVFLQKGTRRSQMVPWSQFKAQLLKGFRPASDAQKGQVSNRQTLVSLSVASLSAV